MIPPDDENEARCARRAKSLAYSLAPRAEISILPTVPRFALSRAPDLPLYQSLCALLI
jgi:hypothetical protein